MTRRSAIRAALAAVALLVAPAARASDDAFQLLSGDEVAKMLGAPDVRIFDANPRDVYAEAHLPGAVFVEKPLAKLLPKDQTTRLVFYCKNPK
jgi:3-mercaptopyruvate sulfurtransferase SseA